jgi:hypothetical protein
MFEKLKFFLEKRTTKNLEKRTTKNLEKELTKNKRMGCGATLGFHALY